MKKILLVALIVVFLLVAGCYTQQEIKQTSELTREETVTISGFTFLPATLTVKQGKTVTWINEDNAPHKIKFDFYESETINKGESAQYTFNDKGKFDYVCSIHPSMQGKIIVEWK